MLSATVRGVLQRLGLVSVEWPNWAVDNFLALSLGCAVLVGAEWMYERRWSGKLVAEGKGNSSSVPSLAGTAEASKFRR